MPIKVHFLYSGALLNVRLCEELRVNARCDKHTALFIQTLRVVIYSWNNKVRISKSKRSLSTRAHAHARLRVLTQAAHGGGIVARCGNATILGGNKGAGTVSQAAL